MGRCWKPWGDGEMERGSGELMINGTEFQFRKVKNSRDG